MQIEWGQWAATTSATVVPIVIYLWSERRSSRRDTEKKHLENQVILTKLATDQKYFPPHEHVEKVGALTVDGIRKAKNGG